MSLELSKTLKQDPLKKVTKSGEKLEILGL